MSELKAVRFIGGFARAGDIEPEDFLAAEVDPSRRLRPPLWRT